jgi:endonuclease YncB( thermonuclease family)
MPRRPAPNMASFEPNGEIKPERIGSFTTLFLILALEAAFYFAYTGRHGREMAAPALPSLPPADEANSVSGAAHLLDGGTLEVNGVRLQLYGIRLPDRYQLCRDTGGQVFHCSRHSARALKDRLAAGELHCIGRGVDANGHNLALCLQGRTDLSQWLVSQGWALADVGGNDYAADEEQARARHLGLWAGRFDETEN